MSQEIPHQEAARDTSRVLAQTFDRSPVIIRRLDDSIHHWTDGIARLYGWSASQAVGKRVYDLLSVASPEAPEMIRRTLRSSGIWQGELECQHRDGHHLLVSVICTLLSDSSGTVPLVFEIHTDVTPRLQMHQQLEASNRRLASMTVELERSNEELEQFARIASHDLSAPITSTRWLVDVLHSRHGERLDESGRQILRQISQGLDRMSELVDAVLTHAGVGTTAISSPEPVPAAEAAAVALENLRKHVETSCASITVHTLPVVNIDKRNLSQLFQNLLSNAIKYRRKDVPARIAISAFWSPPHWQFAVEDNGIGVEPEWFLRIFQPMQRRHGAAIAGSGIGLATCKKIVTRVGGEIWVESDLKVGSTFRFTLPGPAPAAETV